MERNQTQIELNESLSVTYQMSRASIAKTW